MHLIGRLRAVLFVTVIGVVVVAGEACAQVPRPWEIGMQAAHSPVQRSIESLHDLVMVIITAVTLLVAALLAWVLFRYNARRNPTPSQAAHHTVLEVLWTVVPVLILVVIAIPSFRLLYYEDSPPHVDLTVKVTGHQWYWEYTYPDNGGIDFSSYIVPDDKLQPGQLRLLAVDNELVLPAGKNVRLLITSGDVIHSFFVPSLGVQRYAIPGRTAETWVRMDEPGVYVGECNQICGVNHSRMPISIRAVTPEAFTAWLAQAKTQFSDAAPAAPREGTTQLATAAE
jgi:cytochrome c oxidase subunit 2